jgi:hypothetical protein
MPGDRDTYSSNETHSSAPGLGTPQGLRISLYEPGEKFVVNDANRKIVAVINALNKELKNDINDKRFQVHAEGSIVDMSESRVRSNVLMSKPDQPTALYGRYMLAHYSKPKWNGVQNDDTNGYVSPADFETMLQAVKLEFAQKEGVKAGDMSPQDRMESILAIIRQKDWTAPLSDDGSKDIAQESKFALYVCLKKLGAGIFNKEALDAIEDSECFGKNRFGITCALQAIREHFNLPDARAELNPDAMLIAGDLTSHLGAQFRELDALMDRGRRVSA